jgi:hypothetical protein
LRRVADSLKGEKGRLVELLGRRIEQVKDADEVAEIALQLADWTGRDARPYLESTAGRCGRAGKWEECARLTQARVELGDHKALWDYASWLRRTTPELSALPDVLEPMREKDVVRPLWENSDHPAVARLSEWLFLDPRSPWCAQGAGAPHRLYPLGRLAATPLVRVPAFRRALLKRLGDKTEVGKLRFEPDNKLVMNRHDKGVKFGLDLTDPKLPAPGTTVTFRACDYLAQAIGSSLDGAPRCQVYWPRKRRDAAVAACVAFLKHWGGDIHFPRLTKPATPQQVRAGEAIFSLAGQGEVRTVRLPQWSLEACWTTLKEVPFVEQVEDLKTGRTKKVTGYQQSGRVLQAEEVQRGGVWRRYYGFAGSHRAARVSAEEVEFPPAEGKRWLRLETAFDGRLQGPRSQDEGWPTRLVAGKAVPFTLTVYNRSGLDRPLPELTGARLRAWYSPEVVSRQGALAPGARRDADWVELKVKPAARFATPAGRTVGAAREGVASRFDLRDWFDVSRPGFYRVRLVAAGERPEADDTPPEVRFSVAAPGAKAGQGK